MNKPKLVEAPKHLRDVNATNYNEPEYVLEPKLLTKIYDLMVKSRVLEERLIKMYKQNDGFFWLGGPGEEAFNVALGLQIKKGQGPEYDYIHGHYRSSAVFLAMGAELLDMFRQMKNTATDPYSGGRNFIGHTSIRKWNVIPVTSPIEIQFSIAPGTAIANKRTKSDGLTIVIGGDAGTAEPDFASCLIWSSRPQNELPLLMVVTNNQWGISTPAKTQHAEHFISDRAKAFGIKTSIVNGLDPEESYIKIKEAMQYVRTERKPFLIEAFVSRLYGHSSASGANFVSDEPDPLKLIEEKMETRKLFTRDQMKKTWDQYNEEMLELVKKVREEPQPDPKSIWNYIYCGEKTKQERF